MRERFLGVAATAILVLTLGPSPVASVGPPTTASWIITLDPGIDPSERGRELAQTVGGRAGQTYRHALNGFVFEGSAAAAAALSSKPGVRAVVADQPLHIAAESTPPGIRRIDASHPTAPDAHDAGFTRVTGRAPRPGSRRTVTVASAT